MGLNYDVFINFRRTSLNCNYVWIIKKRSTFAKVKLFLRLECIQYGHAPGSVAPDVLLFHRLHYSVDRWQSPVVQYGADMPPAMVSDQCIAAPP